MCLFLLLSCTSWFCCEKSLELEPYSALSLIYSSPRLNTLFQILTLKKWFSMYCCCVNIKIITNITFAINKLVHMSNKYSRWLFYNIFYNKGILFLKKKKRKGKDVKCGQILWPILGICALHLTHPGAHTQQWEVNKHTHTVNTDPEQWELRINSKITNKQMWFQKCTEIEYNVQYEWFMVLLESMRQFLACFQYIEKEQH